MDDDLDPKKSVSDTRTNEGGDGDNSSGDENGLDWTRIPIANVAKRPVIPKRGEKEFEPAPGGGSSLQEFSLERSRQAMVNALMITRTAASKSMSYGVWIPNLARAQVFQVRGVLFNSLGHSMRRWIKYAPDEQPHPVTKLELLPEEALYLVERGSMFCFKQDATSPSSLDIQQLDVESESRASNPMTVQQSYAEMIGREGLNLARYQCYAYLKRLGFVVTRATPPPSTPSYPTPPPYVLTDEGSNTWFARLRSWLASLLPNWTQRLHKFSPVISSCWALAGSSNYPSLFRSLRIIPSGHSKAIPSPGGDQRTGDSPYEVFYHVWKPNTPWKKTAPPAPDFELVVVDGRTTPMPTLHELTNMFARLPRISPPLPRKKNPSPSSPSLAPEIERRTFSFRYFLSFTWLPSFADKKSMPKPHPFAAIRAGHKNVIIGVADAGIVSFFRFGEGCFDEWPII